MFRCILLKTMLFAEIYSCISIKYSVKLYKGVELKFKYLITHVSQRDCARSNYYCKLDVKVLLNCQVTAELQEVCTKCSML